MLVLLGDIFELLKSERWISDGVRPWDRASSAHASTVSSIFEAVLAHNKDFFSGLEETRAEYKNLHFSYVPGNHDRVLNTEMGITARRHFRKALLVQGRDSEPFSDVFVDTQHKVVAKHGHQWDPQNRYTNRGAAIGDAVVIELLRSVSGLSLMRARLQLSVEDPLHRALLEIDNVRPQSPKYMAQWLISHFGRIDPALTQTFPKFSRRTLEMCYGSSGS